MQNTQHPWQSSLPGGWAAQASWQPRRPWTVMAQPRSLFTAPIAPRGRQHSLGKPQTAEAGPTASSRAQRSRAAFMLMGFTGRVWKEEGVRERDGWLGPATFGGERKLQYWPAKKACSAQLLAHSALEPCGPLASPSCSSWWRCAPRWPRPAGASTRGSTRRGSGSAPKGREGL